MKNLKKVLALAVAFVMCFTMFAGALVFTDVPAGGDYSAAITLLSDLGVVAGKPDGSFGINDAITRADAACLIARLMTGEQNPPKYNNAPVFSDVVPGSYYESSVGYCAAMGITSGTGNGKFSPSNTITDGEFVAMLTRALGYDTPEHPLQWPMGNIVVAQQKGLLKNVNIEYASDALRGEDAQMLANALFADYDAAAARKNLYQRADDVDQHITIAEEVFNLGRLAFDADYNSNGNSHRAVDFFRTEKKVYNDGKNTYNVAEDCQAHTWVIAGVDAHEKENTYVAYAIDDDDNKVVKPTVDDNGWAYQLFTYTGDVTPFIGYQVELWGNMDHTGNTIEVDAIRTVEGQSVYDYNASMDGDDDKVKIDDLTLKLKDADAGMATLRLQKDNWQTDDSASIENTWNGRSRKSVDRVYDLNKGHKDGVNAKDLRVKDGDQFKLFDWDSDGDVDFVVRDTAKYAKVEDITTKRIVLASIESRKNDGDSQKEESNSTRTIALNADDLVVNAEGIEEGDIVEITVDSRVYTKADEEVVTISVAAVDPEVKALTKVSTKGDLASFFDGEEYSVANGNFYDLIEAEDPEDYKYEEQDIKRDFDLFLDRNGFIVYSRYSNGDAMKYMMVLETEDGGGRISAHHLPVIKALLENDKVQTFDVSEKLKIYEPDGTTPATGYTSSNYSFVNKGQYVVGRVYRYTTNAKGEITKLVAAFDEETDNTASRYKTQTMTDYSYNEKSLSVLDAASGRWNIEKAKAVFVARSATANAVDQTYVRQDSQGNYYVDAADVIAVKPENIPNIDNAPATANNKPEAKPLDATTRSAHKDTVGTDNGDADFNAYETWLKNTETAGPPATYVGPGVAAILGYTNQNRDVNVALLGVDEFEGFGRNSVKLGILSRVDSDASEKDDEYVYTFYLAVDGKETAEFKSDSVEGLTDIVSQYNATTSKKTTLGLSSKTELDKTLEDKGLVYAEVRFDGDLVDEVVLLDGTYSTDLYVGEYYTVTRAVVGPNKITNGIQFNDSAVTFATEKKFSSISNEHASAYFAGLTADTNYYAIGERPTIKSADKPYEGTTLLVTNDFAEDYAVKGAEKADISYSVIDNNDRNLDDEYYVVDIATEKPGTVTRANMNNKDAVAVVIFEDSMDEGTGFTAVSNSGGMTLAGSNLTTVNDQDREHEIQFNVDDLTDVAVGNVYAATSAADSTGNVSAEIVNKSAVKITVKAGAAVGKYDVVVTSKEYGDYTIVVNVTAKLPVLSGETIRGIWGNDELTTPGYITIDDPDGFLVENKTANIVGDAVASDGTLIVKDPTLKAIRPLGDGTVALVIDNNTHTYAKNDKITFVVEQANGVTVTIILTAKGAEASIDKDVILAGYAWMGTSGNLQIALTDDPAGYIDLVVNPDANWLSAKKLQDLGLTTADISLKLNGQSYSFDDIGYLENNAPGLNAVLPTDGSNGFIKLKGNSYVSEGNTIYKDDVFVVEITSEFVANGAGATLQIPVVLNADVPERPAP